MRGFEELTPGRLWEWHAELENGYDLSSGEAWHGHRVRYREQGTRLWRSFLLSTSDGSSPTEAMVLRAIGEHDASRTARS